MIKLEKLSKNNGTYIITYLNRDDMLLKELKSEKLGDITLEEFLDYNNNWCIKRDAMLFCITITINNKVIGSISLSDIDKNTGQASTGYWITSEYWGYGYGKEAFKEIVKIAKGLGIKRLHSKILCDNIVSRKIWDKYGAKFVAIDEKVMYTLDIESLEV